jgi:hypothetical protein
MEGSFSFIDNKFIGTSDQNGDSVGIFLDSSALDDLGVIGEGAFFDELGITEFLGGELVDMGYRDTTHSFTNEFYFVAFDVLHDHDAFFS